MSMISVTQTGITRPPTVKYHPARPSIDGSAAEPGSFVIRLGTGETKMVLGIEHAESLTRDLIRCLQDDLKRERNATRRVVGTVRIHTEQRTGARYAQCGECDWEAAGLNHDAVNADAENHLCGEQTP